MRPSRKLGELAAQVRSGLQQHRQVLGVERDRLFQREAASVAHDELLLLRLLRRRCDVHPSVWSAG
jgi:hypothetical protein